ncbi:DoxX family protein [Paenibacillus radicis (ex Xue et al. 2023)]|uniref:DoxX family protein n=1 Tax=Paenibacillus radicis (ex Xue et al. 2023) TaxID=2972489 RepID=A0ABT1YUD3_9BACL|nr:DoxX family protein [Paenibacillus radicis (ex Xue et al. 2023)]MCR8636013.1 DoxX family protein [Paenibacillus radicis (ex Xue et al. 2023)]
MSSGSSIIYTIVRILLGVLFIGHGIAKFQMGLGNTAEWFSSIGLPGFFAYIVAYLELIGGAALLVGFATRYISIAYVLLMLGAIIIVKLPMGLLGNGQAAGFELELAYMLAALSLTVDPVKGWGIDRILSTRKA